MPNKKDITEKQLFDIEDVFADIINVLIFNGKETVFPHELAPAKIKTQFKADGEIHEQERDVAKLWMRGGVRFAVLGLENQTEAEKDMILRNFSYDGASYKEQVIHNRQKDAEKWVPYPAITIVLYFGKTHWKGPRTLRELFGDDLPPEIKLLIPDYRLHIYEISFLSPDQVAMFKSDFRIVADYFVQTRKDENYIPAADTIQHVDETLKLLSALTGDNRFENQINELSKKGGSVNMSDVLTKIEQKGRFEGAILTLIRLVQKGRLTLSEAASEVNLPEEEFAQKMEEFKNKS